MASAFVTEIWAWVSRVLLLGSFKKLQSDDYLMMLAMVTDTVLIVSMSIVSHTSSNLIDPDAHTDLTPDNIKERIFGSKMVLVVEQMQILTIWTMKVCLLIMYNRLTMSLRQNLVVKIVAGYVALGFVLMEILYLGVWCKPFDQYWAVPPKNTQCSAATNHLITNAVLNISSDVMIILIPMPLLLQSQLPVKRKAILCAVFALGSFTILSAILNKFYSFKEPFGTNWTFWYIRESSTALITTNLPYIWTLLRRVFNLRSFNGSSHKNSTQASTRFQSNFSRNHRSAARGGDETALHRLDSEDEFAGTYSVPLKIYQRHDVEITREDATQEEQRRSPPGQIPKDLHTTRIKETSLHGSRDDETGSERSAVGVVKVFHGV
ncbi:hypothetical protein G7046_g5329 [Stylonectria norvegica]|nr:hypothetical protein G7046_g5329 [Stylonectria norvegica]